MNSKYQNQLAADIKSAKSGFSNFWRSIFGERDDFSKVSYFRNPESLLDEVLLLLWLALVVASGFTIYYGFRYHLSIFESAQSFEWEALVISMAIFLMGEILKVFLGHRFMRSVFSGMFYRGLPQFVLVICMGILSYYTFKWSIDISAKGYGKVTAIKSKKEALRDIGNYKDVTAPFDAQISEAQKTIEAGRKTTWRGKVTYEGQQIIKDASNNIRQLNADRAAALASARAKDSAMLSITNSKINLSELQQNDYGGKAEYVVLFCLFMIALIEVIAYRQNKSANENQERLNKNNRDDKRSWLSSLITSSSGGTKVETEVSKIEGGEQPPRRAIGFSQDPLSKPKQFNNAVITDFEGVITETVEDLQRLSLTDRLVLKAISEQIRDLNAECRHYEAGNGVLGSIVERIKKKSLETAQSVDTHKSILPQKVLTNYYKVCSRAQSIIVQYKSDKEGMGQ